MIHVSVNSSIFYKILYHIRQSVSSLLRHANTLLALSNRLDLLSNFCVADFDSSSVLLALPSLRAALVELVDMLERHALGLVYHEIHKGYGDPAEASPYPEHYLQLALRSLLLVGRAR